MYRYRIGLPPRPMAQLSRVETRAGTEDVAEALQPAVSGFELRYSLAATVADHRNEPRGSLPWVMTPKRVV